MRLHTTTALLLFVAPCAGALAAQGGLSDDIVLRQMHRANLEEIRMGQLAQRNGSSAQVKQYGAKLVSDHQAADQKVVALAKWLRITLPQERGQMSRGPLRDSDQAISLFELAQGQAEHEELRSLIVSTLPTLREHLQIAQSIASGTATGSSSQQR
jgi:putative membrane protein